MYWRLLTLHRRTNHITRAKFKGKQDTGLPALKDVLEISPLRNYENEKMSVWDYRTKETEGIVGVKQRTERSNPVFSLFKNMFEIYVVKNFQSEKKYFVETTEVTAEGMVSVQQRLGIQTMHPSSLWRNVAKIMCWTI